MRSQAPSSRPRAGIIGAGIAGLSAAIALKKSGWNVDIYEKSQMKNEIGAALTLMTTAVSLLKNWGLDFDKAAPFEFHRMTILHAGSLDTLFHESFPDLKDKYGQDALTFHRVDLHHELLATALHQESTNEDGSRVVLHSGQPVISIDCENGSMQLKSGEIVENDLLVVADGAHSNLFAQFTGSPDPVKRIGRSLYRMLINRDEILANPNTAHLFTSHPDATVGMVAALDRIENTFMIMYSCRSKAPILNVAIVHDTQSSPEASNESADQSWQIPATLAETLETMHNFHPNLKELISLEKEDDIKIHHGMYRPPLKSFVRGKAVLVGDAAHLMMPTHAAGASMAIESAGTLQVLMRDVTTETPTAVIEERLKIFDSLRVPRCTTLQILSNGGFMSQARPEIVQQIREQGYHDWLPGSTAGPYSEEFRRFYFEYDPCTEAKKALSASL